MRRALQSLLAFTALLLLGPVSAWAHGQLHEEIIRLTEALDRVPEDVGLLERRGELYRIHGLFTEAQLDWTKVAQIRPADPTNDLRLGLLALDMKETNAALDHLKRFLQVRPQSLPGQLAAADAFQLAGQPGDAVAHWTLAIQRDPEPRPEWFLQRAKAANDAGMPVREILAGLDEGMARHGPLPALQLYAVDLEVRRGNTDAALNRLAAIAARAERKERWLVRRGDVLLNAGRTNEARTEYIAARNALEQLPEKIRRGWTATELRQQIQSKLDATGPASSTISKTP